MKLDISILMSNNRLNKNIDNATASSSSQSYSDLNWKPVVLSDSKGRYLKLAVNKAIHLETQIQWCYKGGAHTEDTYLWLTRNIENLLKKYGKIVMYIWLGTCDLTKKVDKFIYFNEDVVPLIKNKFERFKTLGDKYNNLKIHFLHIPFYSIEKWNNMKGHPNPEIFKADDKSLSDDISTINNFIDELNEVTGGLSPKFNQDLVRSRKAKNRKGRYSLNFNLLTDGIHPSSRLAKSWLKSLCRVIARDCL